ncbi:hypothetical protein Btru_075293 [Bulinus truncatus]|nr:hypothetical protein Btru_075293 [Bulinus truncatus]
MYILIYFLKKNIESDDGIAKSTSQTSESHATMQESTSSTYVDTIVTGIHENISIATYSEGFAGVEMRLEAVVSPTETALENRDDHTFKKETVEQVPYFDFPDVNQQLINFEDPALWPKNSRFDSDYFSYKRTSADKTNVVSKNYEQKISMQNIMCINLTMAKNRHDLGLSTQLLQTQSFVSVAKSFINLNSHLQ